MGNWAGRVCVCVCVCVCVHIDHVGPYVCVIKSQIVCLWVWECEMTVEFLQEGPLAHDLLTRTKK